MRDEAKTEVIVRVSVRINDVRENQVRSGPFSVCDLCDAGASRTKPGEKALGPQKRNKTAGTNLVSNHSNLPKKRLTKAENFDPRPSALRVCYPEEAAHSLHLGSLPLSLRLFPFVLPGPPLRLLGVHPLSGLLTGVDQRLSEC